MLLLKGVSKPLTYQNRWLRYKAHHDTTIHSLVDQCPPWKRICIPKVKTCSRRSEPCLPFPNRSAYRPCHLRTHRCSLISKKPSRTPRLHRRPRRHRFFLVASCRRLVRPAWETRRGRCGARTYQHSECWSVRRRVSSCVDE